MKLREKLEAMKRDIFWDLSEVNIQTAQTSSLRMTTLDLEKLPSSLSIRPLLRHLDLSHNQLTAIPNFYFDSFLELERLVLTNNKIVSIPWYNLSKLSTLKEIDLRDNPLSDTFTRKLQAFRRGFVPDLQINI